MFVKKLDLPVKFSAKVCHNIVLNLRGKIWAPNLINLLSEEGRNLEEQGGQLDQSQKK